jgi:hypothetical protein
MNSGAATNWRADVRDFVNALAVRGSTVYAGGTFFSIGGQARNHLAALDASTGAVGAWSPNPTGALTGYYPAIYALATSEEVVYVGGDFYGIGGQVRRCLAALDPETGAATDWNPDADNIVWSLALSGNTLYVGGAFHSLGSLPRASLAGFTFDAPGLAATTVDVPGTADARRLTLGAIGPNPVRAGAVVRYTLPRDERVTLAVYDLLGRCVASPLDHEAQLAGEHEVTVRTDGWPQGSYFVRLEAGGASTVRKMLVVK